MTQEWTKLNKQLYKMLQEDASLAVRGSQEVAIRLFEDTRVSKYLQRELHLFGKDMAFQKFFENFQDVIERAYQGGMIALDESEYRNGLVGGEVLNESTEEEDTRDWWEE